MAKRRKAAPREREAKRLRLTSVEAVARSTRLADLPVEIAGRIEELVDCSEGPGVGPTFRRLRCRRAVGEAANKGRMDVLKLWLSSYYGGRELRGAYATIFELAIARGHYDILEWMNDEDKIPAGNARSRGVRCDDPNIVRWLHEQGHTVPLIVELCEAATEEDLEYMKWVLEHRRSFKRIDSWAWAGFLAAYEGNFEIVKWLHVNRPNDFTIGVLKGAISGGHLEIAQWANARKSAESHPEQGFQKIYY